MLPSVSLTTAPGGRSGRRACLRLLEGSAGARAGTWPSTKSNHGWLLGFSYGTLHPGLGAVPLGLSEGSPAAWTAREFLQGLGFALASGPASLSASPLPAGGLLPAHRTEVLAAGGQPAGLTQGLVSRACYG